MPLAALLPVLGPLLDRALGALLPDPEARQKFIGELFDKLMQADVAQLDVNKAEAATGSLFIGGWRPAIGWVCACALAYQYLVVPLGLWVASIIERPIVAPPVLDSMLWELMFGMLGMGALRSFEKIKGVAGK